ncbi:lipid IV(A) 3-deoxy-D-manno-octulosonic acid transferase [Helicobacter sp. MIT 14-3879]|uniref:lipid IV(A) 3-deoxy-D-manno-octulosonic acid transferase n=1 Tax=Helicobacter sp. MIT 14-3879 TaxID=2040649 RepID=UPI000E1F131C|nr:lipid IV(A) 3-deoxy-D-manno-octulosonic acid transferase [Helicobacter sp. MIT 14-3879]RDU65182.1 3-deoxy-D-manno-octulosonic acid transferase [Helicobacter sp. MIT 14-3879]
MFGIFYWICIFLGYILILPILIILTILKPKYRQSIPARFFLYKNIKFNGEVWIHACSLGEINSLQSFIDKIDSKIIISTITNTGYERAKYLFGDKNNIQICYLPFEIFIPFILPKTIKKLIVLEAELWYMLFHCSKKRAAKTILLNARISSKSFPKYKKSMWFYKKIFKNIEKILCQQETDKEKLEILGAKNIEVIGNIKALIKPIITKKIDKFDCIVAASTHQGEEELIINSFLNAKKDKNYTLLVAPRHPERFERVWEMIKTYPIKSARYSQNGLDSSYEVILIDKLGELINIYSIADCVILGGSFVKLGGHNPFECAFFNTKLISGIHIFNQYALFDLIEGYKITQSKELQNILSSMDKLSNTKIIKHKLDLMLDSLRKIYE